MVDAADGTVSIVDRRPGAYSFSPSTDVVVFSMTAEEQRQMGKNNRAAKADAKAAQKPDEKPADPGGEQ